MLSQILALCVCVGAVLAATPSPSPHSAGYGNVDGYGAYNSYPSYLDQLSYEVFALVNNITVLCENDDAIDIRLDDLIEANELNTIIRDLFFNQHLPNVQKAQAEQDRKLTELELQAKALLGLNDEVVVLASTISSLQFQLTELNDTRNGFLQQIVDLKAEDVSQDQDLDAVDVDLLAQETALKALETRSHEVRAKLELLKVALHNIFDAVNSHNAETVTITLTNDATQQSVYLQTDFGGRFTSIQYGITALHVSDHETGYSHSSYGYGSDSYYTSKFNLPNINFNTDVSLNENGDQLTAKLFDLSTGGYTVDKVTLAITVFRIDDRTVLVH